MRLNCGYRERGEEVAAEGGLQMAQSLLHRDAGHLIEPSVLRCLFERRQGRRGLVVTDPFLPQHPRVRAQAEHVVVSET